MKRAITDIFGELGRRLARFGEDGTTQSIIERACENNPWFLPPETERAAKSIAGDMLSADALTEWIARYPSLPVDGGKNVLVVMAGNIPFVGFHDLLCVLAAGHRAVVKTSSKDNILMPYVISELRNIAPELPVAEYTGSERADAVIAMGGNDAVKIFGKRYAGLPMLLRGHRSSLAVLDGSETTEQLSGLADDILSYSGLGCRNVSLVFLPKGYDLAPLKNALSDESRIMNPGYVNNCRQTKALLQMNEMLFTDCGRCVLCEERAFPASVSRINYSFCESPGEADEWIEAHEFEIQCVIGNTGHPRAALFGRAQHPRLTDYPDGRDTMEFLAGI